MVAKKVISIFLFLLFSLVIAFPGYARNNVNKVKRNIVQVKQTQQTSSAVNWFVVIKKCLAKGISAVDEERPIEEDEDGVGHELVYLLCQKYATLHYQFANTHYHSISTNNDIKVRAIPCPPPKRLV